MKAFVSGVLLILLAAVVTWSLLPEPRRLQVIDQLGVSAFLANKRALQALKSQDFSLAQQEWNAAVNASPSRPDLLFNMALGYQLLAKGEAAQKSYSILLGDENTPESLRFMSRFNLGVQAQENKDVPKALEEYQAALDIVPDSRETKINIELLIQNQQAQQGGKDGEQGKDQKEGDQGSQGEDEKGDQPKEYAKNPKPQPKPFQSEKLNPADVNKILGEIRQQEQRIRQEFNKRDVKEQARDKDW